MAYISVSARGAAGNSGSSVGPLGNMAESGSRYGLAEPKNTLAGRYALQSGARELLPKHRVADCYRKVIRRGRPVEVFHIPEHNTARFGGLRICANVWVCPVCAAKITERRRVELAAGLAAWDGKVILNTYTLRHKEWDTLARSLFGLMRARKLAMVGSVWMKFKERHGVAGTVRALEVTHGANGWHPHIHEIMFLSSGADLDKVAGELADAWGKKVLAAGLRSVNAHGFQCQSADEQVGAYVSKFGVESEWTAAHEMTKVNMKKGRSGSFGPFGLLAEYTYLGDRGAGELFAEYGDAMFGSRQLAWSRGLRELLGLGKEKTDEQVAAEVDAAGVLLAVLRLPDWRVIIGLDCRAEVLSLASTGNQGALWDYLRDIGCPSFA